MNTSLLAERSGSRPGSGAIRAGRLRTLFGLMALLLLPLGSKAADILMHNGAVFTSGSDFFYDAGGPSGYYANDEMKVLTIYPSVPGAKVTVNFTDFSTEYDYDYLRIYDGNSTSASFIGQYWGTDGPGTVVSTAADGSLTFEFYSDGGVIEPGWAATVSLSTLTPCSGTVVPGAAIASATSVCPGVEVTFSLTGFVPGSGISYQWDTSSSGTGGWGEIAGATSVPFMYLPPPGTTLYYRCRQTCAASSSTESSTAVVVSCSGSELPYFEDFESTSAGSFPECTDNTYTSYNGFDVRDYTSYPSLDNHTSGGSNYLFAGYYTGMYGADYFFTPAFSLEAGKTYQFSYWYKTDGYGPYTLGAYYGKEQKASAMTTAISPDISANKTSYEQYIGQFTVGANGVYTIGIKVIETTWWYGISIDDIGLIELPPCTGTPSVAGKASVSPTVICSGPGSTTLTLSGTAPVSGLNFQWYEASALGGPYTAIAGATTNPYEASGISSDRYYYCSVTCSAGGSAVHSDTVSVKVAPLNPPYIEDFESGVQGVNMPCASYTYDWYRYSAWYLYDGPHPDSWIGLDNHTPGGSKWLYAGGALGASSGEAEYWFSPGINFTAGKAYSLTFWYNTDGNDVYEIGARYGISQSKSDMTGLIGADVRESNTTYQQFKGDFVVGTTGVNYLGIRWKGMNWWYGGSIDDIGLEQLPPCSAKPAAGIAQASPIMVCTPGEGGSTLSLRGLSAASDLSYQWQLSETGAPGSYTDIAGATDPSYVSDPIMTKTYFRCVVICPLIGTPNADTSAPAIVDVGPLLPPYKEDFETATAGVNQPCASYTYDFESTTRTTGFNNWGIKDMPGAYAPSVDNHTPGGAKYLSAGYYVGSYGLGTTDGDQQYWFTPPIQLTADMAYKCSFWYVSGYSSQRVNYGIYYGTAQDPSAMNAIMPDVTGANNTSYEQISGAFTAPADGVYYLGIKVNHTRYGGDGAAIDDIGLEQLPLCSGKPVAGSISASPTMICNSGKGKLSVFGSSMASMLKYQWQDSTAGGAWANVTGGSGATTQIYTTATISVTHWYRCVVTCAAVSGPGNTDTTAVYQLHVGALDPPYIETFETGREGFNMPCASNTSGWSDYQWYLLGSPYDPYYYAVDNHTPGGKKYLYAGNGLTGSNAYWFSPAINFIKDSTYEFTYWYNGTGSSGGSTTLGMYYGTAQTSGSMTALRPDVTNINITTYKQMIGRLIAPATNKYYLGIKVRHSSAYPGIAIDDIGLNQLPMCDGTPTAGVINASPAMLCSAGTIRLDMDYAGVSKVAGLSYRWEWTTTDPVSGFVASGSSAAQAAPAYTSPTFSSTTWLRCIVKCVATGDSAISSVLKVDVGVIIPPYKETFETALTGTNVPCASYSGDWSPTWDPIYYWNILGAPYSSDYPSADNHTPGGSKYLIAGYGLGLSWSRPGPAYWFTPAIRFTGGKLYQFSFWYNGSGYAGASATVGAYYGNTQTPADMTTAIVPDMVGVNTTVYQQVKTTFTPASSGDYYIGIKVENDPSYSYPGISIDDIGLQEVPPCADVVVAGEIVSTPRHVCAIGDVAVLDLSGSTLATGLTYRWIAAAGEAGPYAAAGAGLPFTTAPLSADTWFRCIVTCAASGEEDTTAPYRVTVGAFAIPYKEDFESTAVGGVPTCSDATYWGMYYYDGFRVVRNGTYTSDYYNHTPGGNKYLIAGAELGSSSYYSPLTDQNYWFTPGLNLRAGYKYRLSFYYIAALSGYQNRMGVYFGTSQSPGAMANTILPFRRVTNSSYVLADTIFMPPAGGVYYLGFRKSTVSTGDYAPYGVAFDDINLNYAPCDGLPEAGIIVGGRPSGTAYCKGSMVRLTNVGATYALVPGISFQWERRNLAVSPVWSPVVGAVDTVLAADTLAGYEYRMRVICNNTGEVATSPIFNVPMNPEHPAVAISPATTPVSFCLGDTVRLNASNFTGAVYDWMRDSVVVPGWKFSDFAATEPGSYMVRVTSALSPCPAYSTPVELAQNDPGYSVLLTKPSDSIICEGEAITLFASASKSGVSYQWRKNNVPISGAISPSLLVKTGGWYRITVSDGLSTCPAVSRNILITVKDNPPAVIDIPGGTLTACEDEGVRLDANTGGYSYQWNHSGSPVYGWVDSSVTVHSSGIYSVKVRTADGCASMSAPVTVNILPSPEPIITRSKTVMSTTFFVRYYWIRNEEDTVSRSMSFPLLKKGRYKVVVEDVNGCIGESVPVDVMDEELSAGTVMNPGAEISVYPNPSSAKVFINSPIPVRVEVKDATGRTVLPAAATREINLEPFADGIYLFLISDAHSELLLKQQRVNKVSK